MNPRWIGVICRLLSGDALHTVPIEKYEVLQYSEYFFQIASWLAGGWPNEGLYGSEVCARKLRCMPTSCKDATPFACRRRRQRRGRRRVTLLVRVLVVVVVVVIRTFLIPVTEGRPSFVRRAATLPVVTQPLQ